MPFRLPCVLPSARRSRPPGGRRGFTLIEILTATAIMSLIVTLVVSVLTQVLSAWGESSDDLTFGGYARSIFDLMAADLQTAIFRSDGSQWLSLTTEVPQGSPSPIANESRLIFYTTSPLHQSKDAGTSGTPGNPIYGDVCAVEYRVVYDDPFENSSSTAKTFSLHRVVVDPASTFYGINGKPMMGIAVNGAGADNTLWQTFDDLVDKTTGSVTNTVPTSQNKSLNINIYGAHTTGSTMRDNIAQFTVFLYYYGYNGTNAGRAPAVQAYPMTTPRVATSYYFGGGPSNNGTPVANTAGFLDTFTDPNNPPVFQGLAYADISITFLTDDGVAQMQSFQGTLPQGVSWNEFLQQYGKTYTQRVRFYNKPR